MLNPLNDEKYDLSPHHTALIGIDCQKGFGDNGLEHTPHAIAAAGAFVRAARVWRAAGGMVIQIHATFYDSDYLLLDGTVYEKAKTKCPLMEGSFDAEFHDGVAEPTRLYVRKTKFSAVAGSDILDILRERGFTHVIIGGFTTPICVGTTCDALSMTGIKVTLISDGCAYQVLGDFSAEFSHEFTVARIKYVFGQIIKSEGLLICWRTWGGMTRALRMKKGAIRPLAPLHSNLPNSPPPI